MTRNKSSLLVLLIIICSFWLFWYPGIKVATDYHMSFNSGLIGAFPWSWREFNVADGLGEYTTFTLWSQPLLALSELMNLISISGEIQTKLMGAVIIFFGLIGIWKLLSYYKINNWGKSIGSMFFILNSFFLLMFDGGQFSLCLAYITLPFAIVSFINLLEKDKWRERIKFSLMVLLISILDIRIIFLLAIILGVYLIFRKDLFKLLSNILISSTFATLTLLAFHAYWILPSLLSKSPKLPLTYDRLSQVDFLSFSSIGHSILLQQPHWFINVFGEVSKLNFQFILIPILVFLSPILIKKNLNISFWLTIAVLGIFLSKGSQEPFSGVYPWLFGHILGFSLFRDPVKFYFLTCLAYSVLIGFTINAISKIKFENKVLNYSIKYIPYAILLYLVFLVHPIYLGWMSGMISKPVYSSDYEQLANVLKSDPKFSRVLWLPSQNPLAFVSLNHPPLEASRLVTKRPFAVSTVGTYETLNFLREAPIMGQLLEVSGIGYLAYPYLDPRRDDISSDHIHYYYTFLKQLIEKPWLSDLTKFSRVPLLKVNQVQDQFFITPNLWWVIGSDSIYNEATKSGELKLSKNALIFAEEYPGLSSKLKGFDQAKIILNKKGLMDLAANFISPDNIIFPAYDLDFQPNKSGWWKRQAADLISWRDFLKAKYGIDNQDFDLGGGWAVSEGNLKLKIKNTKFVKDKILLARALESTRSGRLSFYQENKLVGQIDTIKEGNNVRWFEVGRLVSSQDLTLSSEGDINVINTLAVLDYDTWLNYLKEARDYENKGRILDFDKKNTEEANVSVAYQQIDPTKYKISIKDLKKPTFLVFSGNFDRLWKMENQEPLPVYSLLNGFQINHDGDYIFEFEAQKNVYQGLFVSGIAVIILFLLLIKLK